MAGHDIIVVGASAGGVETLIQLTRRLPADLPAAILVVLHVPPQAPSHLPQILARVSALPVQHAAHGIPIRAGQIYIAPPDRHLLVERGEMRVVYGARENLHRPSIDALFRSAAKAYGPRVIGVVLTGSLDDGAAGLGVIQRAGGVAVVQDPSEALFPSMPESAMARLDVDYCLPVAEIVSLLVRLTTTSTPEKGGVAVTEERAERVDLATLDVAQTELSRGSLSAFTCPECGGTLWEVPEGGQPRFRCRVGHGFSLDTLLVAQDDALETALWVALRALVENGAFLRGMAERYGNNHARLGARFAARAEAAERHADVLRQVLMTIESGPPAPAEADLPNPGPPPGD